MIHALQKLHCKWFGLKRKVSDAARKDERVVTGMEFQKRLDSRRKESTQLLRQDKSGEKKSIRLDHGGIGRFKRE